MSMMPLVSVLMTAFNREKFIAEAIESVLSSDYDHYELIIVDDASSDSTMEVINKFASHEKVAIFENTVNLGDYPNRNRAAALAKGKYLMFCDSDDRFYPQTICYCVEAMEKFSDCMVGYYLKGEVLPYARAGKEVIQQHFFEQPLLTCGPGGSIINRNFFNQVKGYPEKYGPANDMYFNLKVCCLTPVVFLPWLFLDYREHPGQEKNNAYAYMYNNYRYLSDAVNELGLGLNPAQLDYVSKKNNRRFVSNLWRFFRQTKDPVAAARLWRKAGFSARSLFNGIFHTS